MSTIAYIELELENGVVIGRIENLFLRQSDMVFSGMKSEQYLGTLVDNRLPADVRDALAHYTELINDQVLSLIDQALECVLQFGIMARILPAGNLMKVLDFQLNDRSTLLVLRKDSV